MGWGEVVGDYFDRERINVCQLCPRRTEQSDVSGLEELWDARAVAAMRPGDYVLIQFGHNDGGELFETTRPRGSLPGTGTKPGAGNRRLDQDIRGRAHIRLVLRQYAADARARGRDAHHLFTRPARSGGPRGASRASRMPRGRESVAQQTNTPFLDLNDIIARKYEALGSEHVAALFADAGTHTTPEGAALSASMVITVGEV